MYGDRPDPASAVRSFAATRFPSASAVLLGGSILTAHATPTSDLDVVVLLAGPPAPYRETFEHERWVVEAFVHTRASLDAFWAYDARRRVCSLLRMCAHSLVVCDDGGTATEVQGAASARLAQGPPALEDQARDAMRYALTDLLDDLAGCDVESELVFLAGAVLRETASLALAAAGRWGGSGKALVRELDRVEEDLSERLVNGHRHVVLYGDTAVLHRAAVDVLLRVGGPLRDGYHLDGSTVVLHS